MLISEFIEAIVAMSKLPPEERFPILGVGHMGVGKSEAVFQAGDKIGYEVIPLRLAHQDSGDLVGIPRPIDGMTVWSKPPWLPIKPDAKYILFLDEMNRAKDDVIQAFFQPLTVEKGERKIHTHVFPKDVIIVLCINPSNDMYNVTDLDAALYSRCMKLDLTTSTEAWLKWAANANIDDRVTGYIATQQDMLNKPIAVPPCPLSRTWVNVSHILKVAPDNLQYEMIAGCIGPEAAISFKKYCENAYARPISGVEVLQNYPKFRDKLLLQKEKTDAMTATISLLKKEIAKTDFRLEKKVMDNLADFIVDLSREMQVSLIMELPKNVQTKLGTYKNLITVLSQVMNDANKLANDVK